VNLRPTGLVRNVDHLGRVVIPKDLRERLGIAEGTSMEIFVADGGLLFRPYRPTCVGCGGVEGLREVAFGIRLCVGCAKRLAS
jgi:transcriptional pleiotropic regulator of transition state genes